MSTADPEVSVVIGVRDGAESLGAALDSVLSQEGVSFEDRFLMQEALTSLGVGAAVSYSPGVRPDLQIEYETLVTAIAARALTNPAMRELIRELAGPFTLAVRRISLA